MILLTWNTNIFSSPWQYDFNFFRKFFFKIGILFLLFLAIVFVLLFSWKFNWNNTNYIGCDGCGCCIINSIQGILKMCCAKKYKIVPKSHMRLKTNKIFEGKLKTSFMFHNLIVFTDFYFKNACTRSNFISFSKKKEGLLEI